MKKRIKIEEIPPVKESFAVPEGYFDSLLGKINDQKGGQQTFIKLSDIQPLEESFQVPEGYFEGLMDKIEVRRTQEDNVVSFRSRSIRIWGSLVAVACVAMVIVSVINFGPPAEVNHTNEYSSMLSIPDHEIASLMEERDDEFELTEEEIIEVIEFESTRSESTAIIEFLQEESEIDAGTEEEDFFESI